MPPFRPSPQAVIVRPVTVFGCWCKAARPLVHRGDCEVRILAARLIPSGWQSKVLRLGSVPTSGVRTITPVPVWGPDGVFLPEEA